MVDIERLEFKGVSDATVANYKARLNGMVGMVLKARVRDVNNRNAALKYVLKHPNIVSGMMWQHKMKAQTIVNNIAAILKVYESNEWVRRRWTRAGEVWKMRMEQAKKRATRDAARSNRTDSGKMSYERAKGLLADIERRSSGWRPGDKVGHMKWLLLTIVVRSGGAVRANRDMLGCVRLTSRAGEKLAGYCGNYIALKTGEMVPEKLKSVTGLMPIIRKSVAEYPRKWLFVDSRGEPYKKPNSYFKWVGRMMSQSI